MSVKKNCVTVWASRSTSTLADDRLPGTPKKVRSLAPTTSPPTWATGSSTLTASLTQRSSRQARSNVQLRRSNSSHQQTAAAAASAIRTSVTGTTPQPTACKAIRIGVQP